jgi:DNA-directed RNA polymerase sigma subunit (sigma70/sigma32)
MSVPKSGSSKVLSRLLGLLFGGRDECQNWQKVTGGSTGRVKSGNENEVRRFLEAASRAPLFDKEEEARLANAAKQRDTKRLVQAQLRLVVSIGVPVRR